MSNQQNEKNVDDWETNEFKKKSFFHVDLFSLFETEQGTYFFVNELSVKFKPYSIWKKVQSQ